MTSKISSDTTVLYRSIEEQAGRHSVRVIRLLGKKPEPLGLLLVGNTSSETEVASALAGLRFADQPRPTAAGDHGETLPGQAWLRQQLAAELARVRQTRLPCALLLITLAGKVSAEHAAAALAPCLHPAEALSGFGKTGLGLVLPGATVGKARKRAEEIRVALRTEAAAPGLAMGIAVCHAYETTHVDQLLGLAETELARAVALGNDAICQSAAIRAEDSCQVTVEERAQLWMQPRKAPAGRAGIAA